MSGPGDDDGDNMIPEGDGAGEDMGEALDQGKPVTAADLEQMVAKVISMSEEKKRRANEGRRAAREAKKPSKDQALDEAFKPFPMDGSAPVRPLGVIGSTYYFLDALNQLVEKPVDKLSANGVDDLFKGEHAQRWALEHFSRITKEGKLGLDRDLLKRSLIAACGDVNDGATFDLSGRLRGVGAWRDHDGRFVWHVGDGLIVQDEAGHWTEKPVGLHGRMIFPAGTVQPRPLSDKELAESALSIEQRAEALLKLLKSWNWAGGELDARLLLGWIVASLASGALKWRPSAWITGDWGWGKSTIHQLLKMLAGGDDGIVQATNATAAGVWQSLRSRSLPVALDEVEADADNTKKGQVVELARESASGGTMLRGTGEHTGVSFQIWSCFLFSSILMLPLKPQDRSRIIILDLKPFAAGAKQQPIDREDMMLTGRALRRRILDVWKDLDAHMKPWWEAVFEATNEPRCADVFGTVLAFQHAVLHEQPADRSDTDEWVGQLGPRLVELLTMAGRDHDEMVHRLATIQLDSWDKGQKLTVRQLCYGAAGWARPDPENYDADDEHVALGLPKDADARRCNALLLQYQLRVVRVKAGELAGRQYLAIANKGQSLDRLFARTRWQGGVWGQSALRVPGAFKSKQRFDGPAEWAVMVPIEVVLGDQPKLGDGMP